MTQYQLKVVSLILLGFILSLPLLNGSFWLDEAAQALESSRPFLSQFQINGDFQPPLFHLWVHLFAYFSHAEMFLRLASLIPALLTLYLTIKLAKNYLGETGSLIAGLLLATSQFFIFYAQELRPYALSALWGTLSLYLLATRPKSKWLILVNALGLLTVYTYVLVILGQLVYVKSGKLIKIKSFLLSLSLSILLCLPWLPSFLQQLKVGLALKSVLPGWDQVVSPPMLKSLPLLFQKFIVGRIPMPNNFPGWLLPLALCLAVLGLSLYAIKNTKIKPLLIYFWTVILTGFILNFVIPLLDPKRLLFVLPVFVILVTAGLLQFKKYIVLFLILIFMHSVFIFNYWTNSDLQREPWRQAVLKVEQQASQSAPVIFAFNGPFAPWDWYRRQNLPVISTGYLVNQKIDDLDPKLFPLLTQKEVYVFDYLMDLTDPNRLIYQWLTQSGFKETGFDQYPGIGKVRHFQKDQAFAFYSVP